MINLTIFTSIVEKELLNDRLIRFFRSFWFQLNELFAFFVYCSNDQIQIYTLSLLNMLLSGFTITLISGLIVGISLGLATLIKESRKFWRFKKKASKFYLGAVH